VDEQEGEEEEREKAHRFKFYFRFVKIGHSPKKLTANPNMA
jgi:hypothetical protein